MAQGQRADDRPADQSPDRIPVIEETVAIETRTVPTGTVRVSKQITRRTEYVQVPVTHQVVDIRRVPRNIPVSTAPDVRSDGDTLIIPVLEEEIVVSTRLVLREEVHVTTRRIEQTAERDVVLGAESVTIERLNPDGTPQTARPDATTEPNPSDRTEKGTTMATNISVLGIFGSRAALERAVDDLRAEGYRNSDISALFPHGDQSKEFAHEKGTKAPEGAATGAGSGLVVGGVLGWLAGIGSLAIPGVGPLIAAGPIVAALAGAGVGGAVGTITGALIGLGIPEYEAKRYEGRVKEGGILLSVHCDNSDWADKAKDILRRAGAEDVSSTGESRADRTDAATHRSRPSVAEGTEPHAGRFDAAEDYREHYNVHYANTGVSWDAMDPAYQFGAGLLDEPRFHGRPWSEIEPEVRTHYMARYPNGTWERVKDAVRYGWESRTDRRRAA